VVVAQGFPPLLNASSIEAMVAAYDTVVVGEVVSSQDMSCVKPEDADVDEHNDDSFEYPTWHPKAHSTPLPQVCEDLPPTVTAYAVKVSESYRPNVAAGDMITIQQLGGIKDGVAYQGEGDPVLELGHAYLFFLRPAVPSDPSSPLVGSGFGRFEIDSSGKLAVVDPIWDYLKAVSDLEELSLSEVDSAVAAAVAAGPPAGFSE
jgi:hypothetical protein